MNGKVVTILFALTVIAMNASAQIVTEGLISYWPLDSIKEGTAKDSWGDNDGIVQGDPQIVLGKI